MYVVFFFTNDIKTKVNTNIIRKLIFLLIVNLVNLFVVF